MCSPLLLAALLFAQDSPRSVPEATQYRRTSTTGEVRVFLESLESLPHADRVHLVDGWGKSHEGRGMMVVMAGDPAPLHPTAGLAPNKLRLLINANIHGGEVEGKEAVQVLLREIASGEHAELLARCSLLFVPVYNLDGNDRIAQTNRVSQNGPDGGVGERANAQGYDLNRDFIKAESPECQALLALTTSWDPHVWMDLHTTNGSAHGYHLTYAPSLSCNVDTAIDQVARGQLLPAIRAQMESRHGFRVYDYGNFSGREQRAWVTYDHRPRFGTNYVGLRNRFTILSEAYSYLPFRERVEATHAFVLESWRAANGMGDLLREVCARADEDVSAGRAWFGWDTGLVDGELGPILVGEVESIELDGLGRRRIAGTTWRTETMLIRTAFQSREKELLPLAYVIPIPSEACREALRRHGLWLERLVTDSPAQVQRFTPTELRKAGREFQGHHELALRGDWGATEEVSLPAGTWVVTTRQPLGRVVTQLLEPRSEDSLSTWNVFEAGTSVQAEGEPGAYPVLRLMAPIEGERRRVAAYGTPR